MFHNYFFITGKFTNHKDCESPTHQSDICIYYFVSILKCVLMFYYFQFIS